jgi:hypothetical protein
VLTSEGTAHNIWYVSCTEGGKIAGTCGDICATGDLGASLHLGSNSTVGGDLGAAYYTGGCTTYTTYFGSVYTSGICAATDRRAESPVINCSSKANITLSYYYIENGQSTIDNGTVWYYNGSGWSLLEDPPKTVICGGGQGVWAHRTVALPPSADHNPNVKIGFRWVNNEDGVGTDPSFAIDSVSLSTPSLPTASFTSSLDSVCQDSCITFTNTSTAPGTIDSFRWSIVGMPYTVAGVSPLVLCATSTVVPPGTYTMRLDVYGGGGFDSATKVFKVKPRPNPVITKTGHVLSVAGTYASYQWYNNTTPITGATNATYTYTGSGIFKVVVDSGGCKGTSAVKNTVGVGTINLAENRFWTTSQSGNMVEIYCEQVPEEDMLVTVTDEAGRQVGAEKWYQNTDSKQINTTQYVPGLYIIRISNSQTSTVLKWIKQ